MLNPDDVKALDDIRGLFAYGVAPVIAARNDLAPIGSRPRLASALWSAMLSVAAKRDFVALAGIPLR